MRKRTSLAQSMTSPFRCDVCTRQNENAHPERWAEFQQLFTLGKSTYFDKAVSHENTLLDPFDSHGAFILMFNRDIVENVIGDLLHNGGDDSAQSTRARAPSVFKMGEDALPKDGTEVYSVKIEFVLRIKMVSGFVSNGASFQSASRFVDVSQEVTKLSYL